MYGVYAMCVVCMLMCGVCANVCMCICVMCESIKMLVCVWMYVGAHLDFRDWLKMFLIRELSVLAKIECTCYVAILWSVAIP